MQRPNLSITDAQNCSQQTPLLHSSAGQIVTAALWFIRPQLMNPSLFFVGSVLKAHLTFSSPFWGAGNKNEECTCLLSWPTSSALLLNYSRALKCSSVWQHATRVPLFAPHDSSLTELPFMHERVSVCVVKVCTCVHCQTLSMHSCVVYTEDINKTPHWNSTQGCMMTYCWSFYTGIVQTLQRADVKPGAWCFDINSNLERLISSKPNSHRSRVHVKTGAAPTQAQHNL